jgi:glutamate-1-semialdehyde 2,1-aminomutase
MDPIAALDAELLAIYRSRTPKSAALWERGAKVLPGGDTRTGTFFPPYPVFMAEGKGAYLQDVDGNRYVDFLNNFTSLLHGHSHPDVNQALIDQLGRGTVHGSPTELQVRLAEILVNRVASVERIRFCNSGTEATLGALRLAKAFTGRPKILKMEGGYHGSHDQVSVAMAPPYDTAALGVSPGAAAEVLVGSMNELDRTAEVIRKHRHELAAVIVEPMLGSAGAIPAEPAFLRGLREVTSECGVLLIFDEIITFRLGYGGIQEHYGVRPDLTTFGKVVGGGLPVGAFGGRADIMALYDPTRPGTISHSGTYNGNAMTMVAGIATLERYPRAVVEQLNQQGDHLRERLQGAAVRQGLDVHVTGFGSVMQVHFLDRSPHTAREAARGDKRRLRLLHLALLARGIFSASRQLYVLSTVMTDGELDALAGAFEESLELIAGAGKTAGSTA